MNTRTVPLAVAALSGLLAFGCALLAVGHAGVSIPIVSRFGPGGSRAVVPAVIAFAVAAAALTSVAVGAARVRPWAWALGLVVHGLVFVGAALPLRGVGSVVAMVLSAAAVALLVSRAGRAAFVSDGAAARRGG